IQAAAPKPTDVVLDIGGATGYSAAIFSGLVTTVIALEDTQTFLDIAEPIWREMELCNIAGMKGTLTEGAPEHAPYDLIFINGAVSSLPQNLMRQLSDGGRMVVVVRRAGEKVGKATLIQRITKDSFSSRILFDAAIPYLPGF